MILSVPECAVRRKEEDESTVKPCKYNKTDKISSPALRPQLGSVKAENKEEKVDSSTQTYSPNSLYPTKVGPNIQNEKRRSFS